MTAILPANSKLYIAIAVILALLFVATPSKQSVEDYVHMHHECYGGGISRDLNLLIVNLYTYRCFSGVTNNQMRARTYDNQHTGRILTISGIYINL